MVSVSYAEATLSAVGLGQQRRAVHELHLPIQHGERAIGVISLGRLHDEPFTDSELVLVCDLAERAGVDWAQALASARMRQTAHELGAVLETMDEGVYGIDTAGDITLVNRAALEMTGFSRGELLGHNSHRLLHHTHEDGSPYPLDECPVFQSCQTGEAVRVTDEVFWRRDGTSFPVEYSAYPLFQGDEVTGAVVTFLDRRARRQAQRQRDTLHELTRIFAEVSSLAEAQPLMLRAVCDGLGFDVGLIWVPLGEDALRVSSTYATAGFENLVPLLASDRLSRSGTLPGRALSQEDPIVCTDLEQDPPRALPINDPRVRVAVAHAVHSGSQLAAVAEFFSSRPILQEGLVDTLRAIGTQIAGFVERRHAAEETQRMKDQIVANVSHELRTPLTAIDGWVHVLLGEEPGRSPTSSVAFSRSSSDTATG